MFDKVVIDVYSTYIQIPINEWTCIYKSKVFLNDIFRFFTRFTTKKVNTNGYWRLRTIPTNTYYIHNKRDGYTRLPRNVLPKILELLEKNEVPKEDIIINYHKPIEADSINFKIKDGWSDREDQVPVIEQLTKTDTSMTATNLRTGAGKFQPLHSKIKTPGGWTTFGDVKPGDTVTAWDGTPSKVAEVHPQGLKDIYKVSTRDGGVVFAGGEHLWGILERVVSKEKNSTLVKNTYSTLELMDILNKNIDKSNRLYIPHCKSEIIDAVELPIDPYLLGVILGDGHINISGRVRLDTDRWICEYINDNNLLPEEYSINIHDVKKYDVDYSVFAFIILRDKNNTYKPFKEDIVGLGLNGCRSWEKFIPTEYLHTSHEQRLELVRGLLDTDGYAPLPTDGRSGQVYDKASSIEFSTTSEQLAKDFQYLIRSLGGQCKLSTRITKYTDKSGNKIPGRLSYRLIVRYPKPSELFKLPRKKERMNDNNQYSEHFKNRIVSIEKLPKQEECVCIAIDHPDELYITDDFIVTHNTYSAIKSSTLLGKVSMVVCGGLVSQWKDNFLEKSTVDPDKVVVIEGMQSLLKVLDLKEPNLPEVIIWSIHTLRPYVLATDEIYSMIPSYEDFLKYFGVGTIIRDEFHLNLYANCVIDMHSNVKHNLYLSATPARSDSSENKMFDIIYPKEMISGRTKVENYINVHVYTYTTEFIKPESYVNHQGYSQVKYENILLKKEKFFNPFFRELNLIFQQAYINKREEHGDFKILIFCARVDMCEKVCNELKKLYPDLSISSYVANSKESVLDEHDVIVTTIGKCGTGRDIKGLGSIINTHCTRNSIMLEQMTGRLRYRDDIPLDVYDLYNNSSNTHQNLANGRISFYKKISKQFKMY